MSSNKKKRVNPEARFDKILDRLDSKRKKLTVKSIYDVIKKEFLDSDLGYDIDEFLDAINIFEITCLKKDEDIEELLEKDSESSDKYIIALLKATPSDGIVDKAITEFASEMRYIKEQKDQLESKMGHLGAAIWSSVENHSS
jgi:hypothetical protein